MNEKNNMVCAITGKKMAAVDMAEIVAVAKDLKRLYVMLYRLIRMVQEEEKLKQHHRPYLHLRREMLSMCDIYLREMAEMVEKRPAIPCHCSMDCIHCEVKDDVEHDNAKTGEDNSTERLMKLIQDLRVMMEHTKNLRSFFHLLISGVNLKETPKMYDDIVEKDTYGMVDRWEMLMREQIAEDTP